MQNRDKASNVKKLMKVCPLSSLLVSIFVLACPLTVKAQEDFIVRNARPAKPFIPKPIDPDDPKGRQLPPGVPRTVDTNGNVIYIDIDFTTPQYRYAAAKLIMQEANLVAKELQLSEPLPITETNLTEAVITPFGFNYERKGIGSVGTKNYDYGVTKANKFSWLTVANYGQTYSALKKQTLPIEQMDTNAAYQLATQWLAAVSMDVNGLNRDCKAHVSLSEPGQTPAKNVFVPIYWVSWKSPKNLAEGYGNVAHVELFLPTKKLLQLHVRESKYILRKPVVFTNLAEIFPGTAPITIFTNFPDRKPAKHFFGL